MWGAGWGYWGWGWFCAFWIAIIILFIFAVPWGGWGRGGRIIRPEEQILRERYAHGDITREEFEERLTELRHSG